ncbi:30S ribosomal protein S17e [Nanoarchaeota archaeon]
MGRIKTQLIKRTSNELFEKHGDQFKDDFKTNSKIVPKYAEIKSKKTRNTIAGYLTRLVKSKSK